MSVATGSIHEVGAIRIGLCFRFARIRQLQHRLGGEYNGAAADKIAE